MLTGAINRIDRKLRTLHGITEYTDSPSCIFRMEVASSKDRVVLADGTTVCCADRIVVLHLWNEHIPRLPRDGPTLGWGCRLNRAFESSLRELEAYLASRPDLDDVVAIRAEMAIAARERTARLVTIVARYGFERAEPPKRSLPMELHRFGENILFAMLVLVHNPASFRIDTLRRSCTPIFLSRAALRRRFAITQAAPRKQGGDAELAKHNS